MDIIRNAKSKTFLASILGPLILSQYFVCFNEKNKIKQHADFPGGTVVKNPPANAGEMGSTPGPGRSHMLQSN